MELTRKKKAEKFVSEWPFQDRKDSNSVQQKNFTDKTN